MKCQVSRISHTPAKQYSGLYHLQGGMITDADLNEQATIARDRVDLLGNDAIRDGVPVDGGVVRIQQVATPAGTEYHPVLKPGVVYADGLRGVVGVTKDIDWNAKPLGLLDIQADFPEAPAAPGAGQHVVYADIWHRPVFRLEDGRLLEIALHGAETSFRTKVMAQLKIAPLDALDPIRNGKGAFPPIGGGVLGIATLDDAETGSVCDPCAAVIKLDKRVGNALFRVEVVDVEGPANAPTAVSLAWSMENAAVTAKLDSLPKDFADGTFVFEHFDVTTESHRGVFADPTKRERAEFLEAVNPAHKRDFARRWDGMCRFDLAGGNAGKTLGGGNATLSAAGLKVALDFFSFTVDVTGKPVVAGDFWLVELRENAAHDAGNDARLNVVSKTPVGIMHHYAPLFRIKDGTAEPLSTEERLAISFPPLSAIPAGNVSYNNTCPKLYGEPGKGGAETVQEALDKLCAIDADDIGFTHDCEGTYGDADTVGEALKKLCGIGEDTDRGWLKYMFDWGVACGLRVSRIDDRTIRITPGAFLDWNGNFVVAPWDKARDVKVEEDIKVEIDVNKKEPICLGIRKANGDVELVITNQSAFQLSGERTFREELERCEALQVKSPFDKVLDAYGMDDKFVIGKALGLSVSGAWRTGGGKMSKSDLDVVDDFIKKMGDAFRETHSADQMKQVNEELDQVRKTYALNVPGNALEVMRADRAANLVGVFIKASQAVIDACKCAAIWPDCLERGEKAMVPLARIRARVDNGYIWIDDVCMLKCRRQALTPRTMAYYLREIIMDGIVAIFEKREPLPGLAGLQYLCCPKDDKGAGDTGGGKKGPFIYTPDDIARGDVTKPPKGKYFVLDDLPVASAEMILTGNGVEVMELLDPTKPEDILRMTEIALEGSFDERAKGKERVQPGDKVALLGTKDRAEGYIVIERGKGKFAYQPSTDKTAPKAEDEVRDTVEDLREVAAGISSELSDRREAFKVAGNQAIGELTEARAKAKADLDRLNAEIREAGEALSAISGEVGSLKQERAGLLLSLRRERPIVALNRQLEDKVSLFSRAGVLTVGDLAGASTQEVAKMVEVGIGNRALVRRLVTQAKRFLEA